MVWSLTSLCWAPSVPWKQRGGFCLSQVVRTHTLPDGIRPSCQRGVWMELKGKRWPDPSLLPPARSPAAVSWGWVSQPLSAGFKPYLTWFSTLRNKPGSLGQETSPKKCSPDGKITEGGGSTLLLYSHPTKPWWSREGWIAFVADGGRERLEGFVCPH